MDPEQAPRGSTAIWSSQRGYAYPFLRLVVGRVRSGGAGGQGDPVFANRQSDFGDARERAGCSEFLGFNRSGKTDGIHP